MKKIVYVIVVFIFSHYIIFLSSEVLANGIVLDCIGPISSGRGGTNIAQADNGTLIHDNPAALAGLMEKRLDVAIDFVALPMKYKNTLNNEKGKDAIFPLPSFAYLTNNRRHSLGIGVGIYNSAGFSSEYDLQHSIYGKQKYFSLSSLSKILFGAGLKINPKFSIGLGFGAAYSKLQLKLPYTFQTGTLTGATALIDMEADDWAFAWNIGSQWQITPNTYFGLTYRAGDLFDMKGDLNLDGTGGGLPVTDTTAHYKVNSNFRWPQIVGFGLLHYITNQKISFDLLWFDWSTAFDELTMKLSNGDNPEFNAISGDTPEDTLPLSWKDSYSFRVGYEYFFHSNNIFRLGYIYNQNPIPDKNLIPLVPGLITHLISFGYSHTWEKWAFHLGYLHGLDSDQSVDKSDIIGGDFDNSLVEVRVHLLSVGIQYRF